MRATSFIQSRLRLARLAVGALLLLVPACGLSDYEARMMQAQQREQHFRDEQKYLGEPVKIPTRKSESGEEVPLADVFFRPPQGIQPAPSGKPRGDLLWRYPAASGGDFALVELAFAEDDREFAARILRHYTANARADDRPRELSSPGREAPLVFDVWEFDNGTEGYSVHVLRGAVPQVAVAYVYSKGRREALRKAMDVSLTSLAVGPEADAARLRYRQKSPWRAPDTSTP